MFESFFNKVAALQACNFIKKRLQHQVFSNEYCENSYLKTVASDAPGIKPDSGTPA